MKFALFLVINLTLAVAVQAFFVSAGEWFLENVFLLFYNSISAILCFVTFGAFCVPPEQPGFDIFLDLRGVTTDDKGIFEDAVKRWQQVVKSELRNMPGSFLWFISPRFGGIDPCDYGFLDNCPVANPCSLPDTVDDLYICGVVDEIDGPSGVLGFGGPLWMDSYDFPRTSYMVFDVDDIQSLKDESSWSSLILHQIGHILGIGNEWSSRGLITASDTPPCEYLGAFANAEYEAISGCSVVPLSSSCSHWSKDCLGNELMASFFPFNNSVFNPLSRITIASLQDLGYDVSYDSADPFGADDLGNCTCPDRRLMATGTRQLGLDNPEIARSPLAGASRAKAVAFGKDILARSAAAFRKNNFAADVANVEDTKGFRYVGDKVVSVLAKGDEPGTVFSVIVVSD